MKVLGQQVEKAALVIVVNGEISVDPKEKWLGRKASSDIGDYMLVLLFIPQS